MTTSTDEVAPLPEPDVPQLEALPLAADFPAADREQWQRLVKGVLVKSRKLGEDAAPAEAQDALTTTLPDGITVQGIYTPDDAVPAGGLPGVAPFTRGRLAVRSGWGIRPLHEDPDPASTHRAVLDDLEGGADSVWLRLGGDGHGGDGLALAALPEVLEGVYLDLATVVLDAGAETAAAAQVFLDLAAERGVADADLLGSLGADPIGFAARTGTTPDLTALTDLATRCAGSYPGVRAGGVDALPYAEAGATDAQELGLALATGVAYLRALTDAGLPVAAAAAQLEFRYAATVDQFATIAKLRAARRLWARVCELSGVAPEGRGQRQHAVTAWSMLSRLDAHTNLLRSSIAAFAAGIGGADAVTVLPFDAAIGLPDGFSRRIARNTSALLMEESHVAAVTDPAGGSWAVEALTDSLAQAGWKVFQTIEAAGGIAAALAGGLVAEVVGASAAARQARIATGGDALIGVTDFPDLAETPLTRPPAPPLPGGGLPRIRVAEPVEALRAHAGEAPPVVLVVIGSGRPANAARAKVEKFLRAGGIDPAAGEVTPGSVAIVCHARDADPGEVEAALAAARTAGGTALDGAEATDLLQLLEKVLGEGAA